ncbi:unnamed protein product [Eruca vesicaria subsp. sativa]|uniref:Uncharacterized protein n=1 Tax=Eruca vesicaria subsp. sativa TaxID=29727 RepID=A0ABC8KZ92_ERUVS|nr:unnamed protein product [Eruca vesicaria subsp. sativa]
MSSETSGDGGEQSASAGTSAGPSPSSYDRQKEKARVSGTSLILWHAHQNAAGAVRKLLKEVPSLVHARGYHKRTPLHVALLPRWIDVVNCLVEFVANVNAQDRWKNTPLADAEKARKQKFELLKSHGGLSYGQNGSHFDWEIEHVELDFSNAAMIGKIGRSSSTVQVQLFRFWVLRPHDAGLRERPSASHTQA